MEALRGPAADQFHILKAAGLRPVDPAQAGGGDPWDWRGSSPDRRCPHRLQSPGGAAGPGRRADRVLQPPCQARAFPRPSLGPGRHDGGSTRCCGTGGTHADAGPAQDWASALGRRRVPGRHRHTTTGLPCPGALLRSLFPGSILAASAEVFHLRSATRKGINRIGLSNGRQGTAAGGRSSSATPCHQPRGRTL